MHSDGGGGAEPTVTVTESLAEPALLEHVKVNIVVDVRLPVLSLPDNPLFPDHALVAVQDVAFVDVQLSELAVLYGMLIGLAVRLTVGNAGGGIGAPS